MGPPENGKGGSSKAAASAGSDGEDEEGVDSESENEIEEVAPRAVFRTPTKKDLKAPKQFYSRRYCDLLTQFSPKKPPKDGFNLSDLLKSSRFYRNGKLELNYITPKQLEAVEQFMIGDNSSRVRLISDFIK